MRRDTFTTLESSNTEETHWTSGVTIIAFVICMCKEKQTEKNIIFDLE